MTISRRRLEKDFKDLMMSGNSEKYRAAPTTEDLLHWEGMIYGPENTPYEGGAFRFTMNFPKYYPLQPPEVKLITPILHMNIKANGTLCGCCSICSWDWKPAITIRQILDNLFEIITNPNAYKCVVVPELAQLYSYNPKKYLAKVRNYTHDHAMDVDNNCMVTSDIIKESLLQERFKNKSLMMSCRSVILMSLLEGKYGEDIDKGIEKLPLPNLLKSYVKV